MPCPRGMDGRYLVVVVYSPREGGDIMDYKKISESVLAKLSENLPENDDFSEFIMKIQKIAVIAAVLTIKEYEKQRSQDHE